MITTNIRTALITGASSGIGLEFANLCAKNGYNLILIARQGELLEKVANEMRVQYGISVFSIGKDLSDFKAVEEVVTEVEKLGVKIDILINNAGFGDFGNFVDTDWNKEHDMIELNIVTLTYFTKIFLKKMKLRGEGKILNVASTAAFQPGPLMAVYYATKAYVLSFSEAVAHEIKGTGVTLTVLCPGPTATGFQKTASQESSKLVAGKKLPKASEVAKAGYYGMMKGKVIVIPGLKNKFLVQLLRFTPRFMVRMLVAKLQEVKK